MGVKQQPKCKERTCRFCYEGKYCTILKERPIVCRFCKERTGFEELAKEESEVAKNESL